MIVSLYSEVCVMCSFFFFEADGFLSIAMVLLVTVGRTIDDSFKAIFTSILL